MKLSTIVFLCLLIILNIAYIKRFITIYHYSKIIHNTDNMDKIDVGKSLIITNGIMIALCLFIAISGFLSQDVDSIVIGSLLALAFCFQALSAYKQRYLYIGRTNFVFNGLNIKYKNIKKAIPPKGFLQSCYKVTTINGEQFKLPIKAVEEMMDMLDSDVFKK